MSLVLLACASESGVQYSQNAPTNTVRPRSSRIALPYNTGHPHDHTRQIVSTSMSPLPEQLSTNHSTALAGKAIPRRVQACINVSNKGIGWYEYEMTTVRRC